ncbi:hypothetical protein [Bacillus cereus]|nr:hypothetical protein [Bacillus cereus]
MLSMIKAIFADMKRSEWLANTSLAKCLRLRYARDINISKYSD